MEKHAEASLIGPVPSDAFDNTRIELRLPAEDETWLQRVEAACRVVETWLPYGLLLRQTESRKPVPVRERYLKQKMKTVGRLVRLDNGRNGGLRRDVHHQTIDPRYVQLASKRNEPSLKTFGIRVSFQPESWRQCEELLIEMAEATGAYFGWVENSGLLKTYTYSYAKSGHAQFTLDHIADQRASAEQALDFAARIDGMLSALGRKLPHFSEITGLPYRIPDAPEQPMQLWWLNYWSERACKYLGFPDPARDEPLLAHSYQTPSGAWLVKLGAEPVDLERPEHLAMLADAYERFPNIGLRALESATSALRKA